MTIQQLRYFISVADLHSFTKAAKECHVSQPALSYAIRELESELGCSLFLRMGRSVQLTAQGEACLEKAREAERALDEMTKIAAQEERTKEIRLGYTVLGHLNAYRAFQSEHVPKGFLERCRVFTVYDEITEIKRHLIEGKYDMIILPAANCNNLPPCEKAQITPDRLNLIVSRKNPLSVRKRVGVGELAEQGFIFAPNNDDLNQAYTRLCEQHGFVPHVVGHGKKMGDMVSEVVQKNAVAFCSATFHYLENDEVCLLEIEGNPSPFHLELVRIRSNGNHSVTELFRFFRK